MSPTAGPGGAAIEILEGGLLTTVQDAGRPDWTHLGVPESGAADPWSLAIANLLAGNEPGAAVLEATLAGPTFAVRDAITIGLAGADLGARLRGGRRLAPGRSHRLAAGDVVEMPGGGGSGTRLAAGARAYLAISGGIDVPVVLGSRSTCLPGAFGGFDGRALRAGDGIGPALASGDRQPAAVARPELVWPVSDDAGTDPDDPGDPGAADRPAILRVVGGPAAGLDVLLAGDWRVGAAADRVGVRLDGESAPRIGGETLTHGVPWGAIQVPPDGRPIVLGADHQATGGYPVVGVVISADLPVLGQLRPGARVRLVAIDRAAALVALRARREALVVGAAALRDAAGWDALAAAAGG